MRKMTAAEAKAIKRPGTYRCGDTLYLRVGYTGSKSWVQRLVINGKRHDIGLGSFRHVGLADARELALANQRAARVEGRNPLAEKRRERTPDFATATIRTWEALKPRWRAGPNVWTWRRIVEKHAGPAIGHIPIDQVGREDVLHVLVPLWSKTPDIARRLRQNMQAIFRWAQAHGYIDTNPAGEVIDGALPKQKAAKTHLRALPHKDVSAALEAVGGGSCSVPAELAFRFLILTATRTGEVLGTTWDEIDLETRTWTIPATRMKMNREHRVPLSDAAVAVLDKARILADGSGLVFPSPRRPGKPMSSMTLAKLLERAGYHHRATVHGFRSSFRDWCADTGKPREIAEAALARAVPGVEGAYFRTDLFQRRALLMSQWAQYLAGADAKIVELKRA